MRKFAFYNALFLFLFSSSSLAEEPILHCPSGTSVYQPNINTIVQTFETQEEARAAAMAVSSCGQRQCIEIDPDTSYGYPGYYGAVSPDTRSCDDNSEGRWGGYEQCGPAPGEPTGYQYGYKREWQTNLRTFVDEYGWERIAWDTEVRIMCVATCPGFIINGVCAEPEPDLGNDCGNLRANPVNVVNGNKYQHETDWPFKSNPYLSVSRHYNSLDAGEVGFFGTSWSSILDSRMIFKGSEEIVVKTPEGERVQFFYVDNAWVGYAGYSLTPMTGHSSWGMEHEGKDETYFFDVNGNIVEVKRDGKTFVSILRPSADVVQLVDQFSNALEFEISDSRITKSNAIMGFSEYTYDTNNNLIEVRWISSAGDLVKTKSYGYQGGLLTSIAVDGVITNRWTYDSEGRVLTSDHGPGLDLYQFSYTSSRRTDLTNPKGHLTKFFHGVVGGSREILLVDGVDSTECRAPDTKFEYDIKTGRLRNKFSNIDQAYDERPFLQLYYDADGFEIDRSENGINTSTIWDKALGVPTEIMTPALIKRFTYDSDGNVLTEQRIER